MSTTDDHHGAPSGGWSAVAHHDWESSGALETTLQDAFERLGSGLGEDCLYQYVDVEAVTDALAPDADRGASAVCFEYRDREVRVSRDGTVAVR